MERKKILIGVFALLFLALAIGSASAVITGDIEKPTDGEKFNTQTNINFTAIPYESFENQTISNITLRKWP